MISRRTLSFSLERPTTELDAFGQEVQDFTPLGTVEFSITLKENKILENNPIYVSATHIGITKSDAVALGDRLVGDKTYELVLLLGEGRYKTWLLKEVV